PDAKGWSALAAGRLRRDRLAQHARRKMFLRRDDENHLTALFCPELAVIRICIGMHEIAGPETPSAREQAAGHDITFLGAAVVVRRKARAWLNVEQQGGVAALLVEREHLHPDAGHGVR